MDRRDLLKLPALPGVPGHEPDPTNGRRKASAVGRAMDALLEAVPRTGSYVAVSDYFRDDWQRAFWDSNGRLAAIKRRPILTASSSSTTASTASAGPTTASPGSHP